ncbi:hypothetical protein evm_002048 [Chilo suppressalis]|nr:hypothetical protein evm_002048 [Chilo suppressalis]
MFKVDYHIKAIEELPQLISNSNREKSCFEIEAIKFGGLVVKVLDTFYRKVKSILKYFTTLFPTIISCDFNYPPTISCHNCHQVIRCLPYNVGIVSNCFGCFPYCNEGRCSQIPQETCLLPNSSNITVAVDTRSQSNY